MALSMSTVRAYLIWNWELKRLKMSSQNFNKQLLSLGS